MPNKLDLLMPDSLSGIKLVPNICSIFRTFNSAALQPFLRNKARHKISTQSICHTQKTENLLRTHCKIEFKKFFSLNYIPTRLKSPAIKIERRSTEINNKTLGLCLQTLSNRNTPILFQPPHLSSIMLRSVLTTTSNPDVF